MSASDRLRQLEGVLPAFWMKDLTPGGVLFTEPQAKALVALTGCLPEIRAYIEITSDHGFGHQMTGRGEVLTEHHPNCHGCKCDAALAALERKLEQADHELLITNDTSSSLVVGEQA